MKNKQSIPTYKSHFLQVLVLKMGTVLHSTFPLLPLLCLPQMSLGYHSNSSMKWGIVDERDQVAATY